MEEARALQRIDKKLLNDVLDSSRDAGADLPRKQRERLREISLRISPNAQKFSENVLDSRNASEKYVEDVEELKDLPEITIDILREDGLLHPSSSAKVMQYLENERLREENFRAS
jgi:Zn-dependent oligopeptidase